MFGLCKPIDPIAEYRSVYTRCCRHQRLHYGALSLPFLSYEAVLLFATTADACPNIRASLPSNSCGRRYGRRELLDAPDSSAGLFCASLSLLLASVKLADDVRDVRSRRARIASWLLQNQFAKANAFFGSLDHDFGSKLKSLIEGHIMLESSRAVSLEEYAVPTANAFSYIFGLASRVPGPNPGEEFLRQLGKLIGTAIISFDCAYDWAYDRKHRQFNPLRSEEEVIRAGGLCKSVLCKAADLCATHFSDTALTTRTLRSVTTGIVVQDRYQSSNSLKQEMLEMLGLARNPRYIYARGAEGCIGPCICLCMVGCLCNSCCSSRQDVHVYHHKGGC